MKYIKQFVVIILVSCIGELLNYIIPLPIPGSIYGMIILLLLLCLGIIEVKQIKEISDFLIEVLPVLFIPASVGIISQLEQIKNIWFQIIIITIISTMITMVVTGIVSQSIIKYKKKKKGRNENELIK